MVKVQQETTRIVRSTRGLCDAVMDEIDALRSGTGNPARANAVSKLASVALETVRVEIEVQKYLKAMPESSKATTRPAIDSTIKLGSQ